MHKINTSTAVDGEFVDGNPATGQKATELNAAWFNTFQRELLAFLTDAGVAPSLTDDNQLLKIFPTNGAWKCFFPSNETINVESWAKNSVILPSIWSDALGYSGSSIKNALMIVFPRWDLAGSEESCTYTHSVPNHIDMSVSIPRGNILFAIFNENGSVTRAYCMPSSANDTISILKKLTVGDIDGVQSLSANSASILEELTIGNTSLYSGLLNLFGTLNFGSSGKRIEPSYILDEDYDISDSIALAGVRRTFVNESATPFAIVYHPNTSQSYFEIDVYTIILPPYKSVEFISRGEIAGISKGAWTPAQADFLRDSNDAVTSGEKSNDFFFAPLIVTGNVTLFPATGNINKWKTIYNHSANTISVTFDGGDGASTSINITAWASRVFIGLGSGKWTYLAL